MTACVTSSHTCKYPTSRGRQDSRYCTVTLQYIYLSYCQYLSLLLCVWDVETCSKSECVKKNIYRAFIPCKQERYSVGWKTLKLKILYVRMFLKQYNHNVKLYQNIFIFLVIFSFIVITMIVTRPTMGSIRWSRMFNTKQWCYTRVPFSVYIYSCFIAKIFKILSDKLKTNISK